MSSADQARTTDGQLEETDGQWRLRFVRELPHPPEKVWRAITEPEHLSQWFPTDVVGDRVEGATLRFVFRENEADDFDGELLTYDPPRVLAFMWGPDLLRFELQPTSAGTVLTFTDTLDERGKAARDGAGWHVCLEDLEHELTGANVNELDKERWRGINPRYVDTFGPEASSIGPPEGF